METLNNFLLDWGSEDSNRLLFFLFVSFLLGLFGGYILWGIKLHNAEDLLEEKNDIVKNLSAKVDELKLLVQVAVEEQQASVDGNNEKKPIPTPPQQSSLEKKPKSARLVVEKPIKQPTETVQESVAQDSAEDDLKKIAGVNAKTAELLRAAGIHTYRQLSETGTDRLHEILETAGKNPQKFNTASWSLQAALAHEGKWDELSDLQSKLKAG
jgi:predicted flap endonuclease-1-like 5' DNA nuclease